MIGMSSARKNGPGGIVTCMAPDVCKTQIGPATVPVPYMIISMLSLATRTEPTVKFKGEEAMTLNSRLSKVIGDEPGALGGVISNVNMGMCRPTSFHPTVKVGGHNLIENGHFFEMNCSGPNGPANTIGSLLFFDLP